MKKIKILSRIVLIAFLFYLFNPLLVSAAVPSAPSDLTATAASSSQINLSWQDNSNDESGFKIERDYNCGGTYVQVGTVGANVTTFSNTGLSANTLYCYRVAAYNNDGSSVYSNAASATTYGTLPVAPTNLTGTAISTTQIDLTWQDKSNNETGFNIERAPDTVPQDFTQIAAAGANIKNYSDTGLTEHTLYYYRVRAYNAAGNSGYSNTVSVVTQLSVIPNPSIIGFFPDVGSVYDVVVSQDGNTAYLASGEFGLVTVDVSNPQNPTVLGSQRPLERGRIYGFDITLSSDDKLAFLSNNEGVSILDISDRNNPKFLSTISGAEAVPKGDYIFLLFGGDVKVVDISVPSAPSVVATLVTPGWANGIAVAGNTAVVADDSAGLHIVDISNPLAPRITGTALLGGFASKVGITGQYAVVANAGLGKLQIVDFANPLMPTLVSAFPSTGYISIRNFDVKENLIAISQDRRAMKIVDISDPVSPQIAGEHTVLDGYFDSKGIQIKNQKVYFAGGKFGGLVLLDISNLSSITQISQLKHTSHADRIFVDSARNFAIAGKKLININNPEYPQVLSTIDADISVSMGDYIYSTSASGDFKIYDATNLSSPVEIKTVITPGWAEDIAVSGTLAIVADNTSGIQIIDISNPANASIIGTINLGQNIVKVAIKDHYAFVGDYGEKIHVVDFANASAPTKVGELSIPGANVFYSLDISGNYLYVGTNNKGMYIVDISNPTTPIIKSNLYSRATGFSNVRGVAIDNNIAYVAADYISFDAIVNAGIFVVDVTNKSAPTFLGSCYSSIGLLQDVVLFQNKLYAASDKTLIEIYNTFADKITLLKTADKYTVSSGDEVTFTLTAVNTSPNTLTNLNLSDPIPTRTTYVQGSASGGGTYDSVNKKVVWTIPSIAPAEVVKETFKVKVE